MTTTIDPDKLLTIEECREYFGLDLNTYRQAVKNGELKASGARGVATRIRADDARAFTLKFHEDHPVKVTGTTTTEGETTK